MPANICIYCGSNPGTDSAYAIAAQTLGHYLADHGHTLVYGGGNVGLMGIVADAALANGGQVIGVITEQLVGLEVVHRGLSKLHIVDTMHTRKAKMAELADCFIALPGGVGTLEEIIEVFVWTQLDIHRKACGFLNVKGYYDGLNIQFEHMVTSGFLKPKQKAQIEFGEDPSELVERLLGIEIQPIDKRLDHA